MPAQPTASRRYGRLKTCATAVSSRRGCGAKADGTELKHITKMKTKLLVLTFFSWLIASLLCASNVHAQMMGARQFVLDFTNSASVKSMATWSDQIEVGKMGLGWAGPTNAGQDVWIETVPQGVGWSWRSVDAVVVRAEIIPPGKFEILHDATHNQVTFPDGQLYARCSSDKKHWSSWQNLEMEQPTLQENARQLYRGTIRIPYRDQTRYEEYLRKFDSDDEEALAKWIIQHDPSFFEKQMPFVGYVQFLFETQMKGGAYLEAIKFDLQYTGGG